MRMPFLSLLAFFLLAALFTTCGKKTEPDLTPLKMNEITGANLWQRFTADSDYRNYGSWPGHDGMRIGQAPHGPYHKIFINKTLAGALPLSRRIAPEGALVVKENYNADKVLTGFTVMAKVKNFAPGSGDWFWAKYDAKGRIQAEGTPKGCISCHEGMKDNDYIIVQLLDAKDVSPK